MMSRTVADFSEGRQIPLRRCLNWGQKGAEKSVRRKKYYSFFPEAVFFVQASTATMRRKTGWFGAIC